MATIRRLGLFYNCPLIDPLLWGGQTYFDFFQELAAPLRETMAFVWRVKKWSFQPNLNSGWSVVRSIYSDNLEELKNEKSLLCNSLIFTHDFCANLTEDGEVTSTVAYFYSPALNQAQKWPSGLYSPGHFFLSGLTPESMSKTGYLSYSLSLGAAGYVAMSPQEYWEYDPGDGKGPIFNSTTGKQIRPFPDN